MRPKQRELLELLAANDGSVDVYDERLESFSDDDDPDTINQCARLGWCRQRYDGDTDNGDIWLLPAGRRALEGEKR